MAWSRGRPEAAGSSAAAAGTGTDLPAATEFPPEAGVAGGPPDGGQRSAARTAEWEPSGGRGEDPAEEGGNRQRVDETDAWSWSGHQPGERGERASGGDPESAGSSWWTEPSLPMSLPPGDRRMAAVEERSNPQGPEPDADESAPEPVVPDPTWPQLFRTASSASQLSGQGATDADRPATPPDRQATAGSTQDGVSGAFTHQAADPGSSSPWTFSDQHPTTGSRSEIPWDAASGGSPAGERTSADDTVHDSGAAPAPRDLTGRPDAPDGRQWDRRRGVGGGVPAKPSRSYPDADGPAADSGAAPPDHPAGPSVDAAPAWAPPASAADQGGSRSSAWGVRGAGEAATGAGTSGQAESDFAEQAPAAPDHREAGVARGTVAGTEVSGGELDEDAEGVAWVGDAGAGVETARSGQANRLTTAPTTREPGAGTEGGGVAPSGGGVDGVLSGLGPRGVSGREPETEDATSTGRGRQPTASGTGRAGDDDLAENGAVGLEGAKMAPGRSETTKSGPPSAASTEEQSSPSVSRETEGGGGVSEHTDSPPATEDEAAVAVREAALRAATQAGVAPGAEQNLPQSDGGSTDDVSRETFLDPPPADDLPRVDTETAARNARVNFRIATTAGAGPRRVLAVANQKGGVGKSTTAVNLGAYLALAGARVLVIDLDPQGNASTGLGLDHRAIEPSVYDVLSGSTPATDAIRSTSIRRLHVLPSTIDLAGAEVELVSAMSRESRLRRALDAIHHHYDTVLVDCPPSLGLLTVNALTAADELLIPIQCEYYALEGLGQLLRNVELVRSNLNHELRIGGIVLTMYDGRTRLAEQVVEEVRRHFSDLVYQTVVPRSVRLSEAPGYGLPIALYDPLSRGGIAYRDLAFELAERNGLLAPTAEGAT